MAPKSAQSTHSRLRALEGEAERLLAQYSGLVQTPTAQSSVPDDLATNLSSRTSEIDRLAQLSSEPGATATLQHQVQRHREVLEEHRTTSRRLAESLVQERNRHNLLSNVRSDIAQYRAQSPVDGERYLMGERSRIENSNSVADRLLTEAYATRADFAHQQATLANIQRRIWTVFSKVPGINAVISKINSRQKRNSLILAAVITMCILLLFFFH